MRTDLIDFCNKWLAVLSNSNSLDRDFIENTEFADDCFELGFVMDCGDSFIQKYGKEAFYNAEVFFELGNQVDDIDILCSGIFSQ